MIDIVQNIVVFLDSSHTCMPRVALTKPQQSYVNVPMSNIQVSSVYKDLLTENDISADNLLASDDEGKAIGLSPKKTRQYRVNFVFVLVKNYIIFKSN